MLPKTQSAITLTNRSIGWWLLPIGTAVVLLFVAPATAQVASSLPPFQKLVDEVPRAANAIVILNMERAMGSPLALSQGWNTKLDSAFRAGLVRVPPQAKRFVMASQIDFEFMQPEWEAAVMDAYQEFALESIAQKRGGTLDTIEGLPAVAVGNDTYLIQLGPTTSGAMGPANRQMVVRWIREVSKPTPTPLSPYLQRAAVYSDDTGSEVIMAIDLDGVLGRARVAKYLDTKKELLAEWGADPAKLASLLCGIQGIRLGIRIGEHPTGRLVVDLRDDASFVTKFAKPLLLEVLADIGASIGDFDSWTGQAAGKEISLAGNLSDSGLRRLLSVIDSPAPEKVDAEAATPTKDAANDKAKDAVVSPGDLAAIKAKASRDYFRAVLGMSSDLREDMGKAKSLSQTRLWFDKYAKRIERLPMLNVDDDLLDYGEFVAAALRKASGSVATMGIQSSARQSQILSAGGSGDWNAGYSGYRNGAYGTYGYTQMDNIKATDAQRRAVRAQEKGAMATDVQSLRAQIIATTTKIRREMTQRYNIQF